MIYDDDPTIGRQAAQLSDDAVEILRAAERGHVYLSTAPGREHFWRTGLPGRPYATARISMHVMVWETVFADGDLADTDARGGDHLLCVDQQLINSKRLRPTTRGEKVLRVRDAAPRADGGPA